MSLKEMFSRKSSPTTFRSMQVRVSPDRKLEGKGRSSWVRPSATTVARIPEKLRLRITPRGRELCSDVPDKRRELELNPIQIGPVTSFITRLEKSTFSIRPPLP